MQGTAGHFAPSAAWKRASAAEGAKKPIAFGDGFLLCGERGIRTPGTRFRVRMFSKHVVSATHPPLRVGAQK